MTTNENENETGPERRSRTLSHRELRLISGIALALLPAVFFVSVLFTIDEALDGSGPGPSGLADLGAWLLGCSGVLGLAALLLPARRVGHRGRWALLIGQVVLMPVGLALIVAA
ncbi:hypothetical protein [Streptomyces sp. NPDC048639]|uniref:hypothetical protein n=1 Tax=Streptomyces sp. NPDC048639 TaxID=3365581 RepID=UPI0037239DC3